MRRASGIFFFVIGMILLIIAIGLDDLLISPVILIFASFICWRFYYRRTAVFLLIISALALIDVHLWALLLSVVLIYVGYQLLWSQKGTEIEDTNTDLQWKKSFTKFDRAFYRKFHLGEIPYELFDLHATNAVQNVRLDLSRASIPEGETTITLNGLAGRIYFYLPPDLAVSISVSGLFGECEVLGARETGLHNSLQVTSPQYAEAARKLKISVSFVLADVQVKHLS